MTIYACWPQVAGEYRHRSGCNSSGKTSQATIENSPWNMKFRRRFVIAPPTVIGAALSLYFFRHGSSRIHSKRRKLSFDHRDRCFEVPGDIAPGLPVGVRVSQSQVKDVGYLAEAFPKEIDVLLAAQQRAVRL